MQTMQKPSNIESWSHGLPTVLKPAALRAKLARGSAPLASQGEQYMHEIRTSYKDSPTVVKPAALRPKPASSSAPLAAQP